MSVIGKQIKKYRVAKGITQEQLGQLVGVTTQAVSKWERGGTPDAELLPRLSQLLDVSIDVLFGREEQSFVSSITRKLRAMPIDDAYRFAFSICWAIEIGLMQDKSAPDEYMNSFLEHFELKMDKSQYFSKIMKDSGISTVRIAPDFRYFFLMVEPKNSIKDHLADIDTLQKVFEIFADKKLLSIIFYMYSRLNTPVATSLISKSTGLSCAEVDSCMDKLCKNNLATKNVVATADGEINTYMFKQESSVMPLLCYADEIAKTEYRDFLWDLNRSKPLLK